MPIIIYHSLSSYDSNVNSSTEKAILYAFPWLSLWPTREAYTSIPVLGAKTQTEQANCRDNGDRIILDRAKSWGHTGLRSVNATKTIAQSYGFLLINTNHGRKESHRAAKLVSVRGYRAKRMKWYCCESNSGKLLWKGNLAELFAFKPMFLLV